MLPKWLVNKELKSSLIQEHAEAKAPESLEKLLKFVKSEK